MNRHEVAFIVFSVLASAIGLGLPLVSMLWKAFNQIAELKLQISDNKGQILLLTNKVDHFDERWESATHQTIQKFDHFSNRLRGEVRQLDTQMREVQNFLSKTTEFEVRSQG